MSRFYVLFNPLAGSVQEEPLKAELAALMPAEELSFFDVTKIGDWRDALERMDRDGKILLVGGDGTLNRFINLTDGVELGHSVWYFAAGNGNDFWNDLGRKRGDAPVCIDEYLVGLPSVAVNGKSYKFINGIGFGIDGYCCEKGDELRAAGKKVNYTKIAVTGLLFRFKPRFADVTVDGQSYAFKKTWIAPTMNGRFYGGGMIPTPEQNRLDPEKKVSLCVMYGAGKLRTLMTFPKIFSGEHVKKEKLVKVLSGHTVTVKFKKPCALQIDGETIRNVTEYTVTSAK